MGRWWVATRVPADNPQAARVAGRPSRGKRRGRLPFAPLAIDVTAPGISPRGLALRGSRVARQQALGYPVQLFLHFRVNLRVQHSSGDLVQVSLRYVYIQAPE